MDISLPCFILLNLKPKLNRNSKQMVRTLLPSKFRTPWMFIKKGERGQRKIGQFHFEKFQWPGQRREFPELSPKFQQNNREELRGYTGALQAGYVDQTRGKFVHVPEMVPELVVPNLSNFELKPYVSYRVDIEEKRREKKYQELLVQFGNEEVNKSSKKDPSKDSSKRWPPPVVDAKLLFDHFYADKIRADYTQPPMALKKKEPMAEKLRQLVGRRKK